MIDKLQKIRRLSAAELWLLAQAILLLPAVALGLRVLGLRRCQAFLTRLVRICGNRNRPRRQPSDGLAEARLTARVVELVARHGWRCANCLQRSLTLWWLLLRKGIVSDLRIGVRKEAGRFEAHAWVELAGLVLNDSRDVHQRFAPFDCPIFVAEVGA